MNNFMISLKKFFKNKNTVTIIGVVLIIMILFFGYRYQIRKQVKPITGTNELKNMLSYTLIK